MKLLMLTNDWPPIEGGISTLCVETARALALAHEVVVVAPRLGGAAGRTDLGRVRVERWRGYGLGYFRFLPASFAALQHFRKTDAVLAMNPAYGGLLAALAHSLGGPRYFAWAYGYELLRRPRFVPSPANLYRHVFNRAQRAIAISRFTRDILLRLGVEPQRVAILHPGVAVPPPRALVDGIDHRGAIPAGPVILSVGRLIKRKGHLTLVEAMAQVHSRHPSAQWVVIGRGPLDAQLRAAISARQLDHCVHLLGYVGDTDLDAWYRAATLFALTPDSSDGDAEGFGLVYLEAGARGLPVVAGHSGGVVDAVADGITGLLVDPTDAVAIANAILQLLDRPEYARRLGENGRAAAVERSWTAMASELERHLSSTP